MILTALVYYAPLLLSTLKIDMDPVNLDIPLRTYLSRRLRNTYNAYWRKQNHFYVASDGKHIIS